MEVRRRDYEIYYGTAQQVGLRRMTFSNGQPFPSDSEHAGYTMRFMVAVLSLTLESDESLIGRYYEV